MFNNLVVVVMMRREKYKYYLNHQEEIRDTISRILRRGEIVWWQIKGDVVILHVRLKDARRKSGYRIVAIRQYGEVYGWPTEVDL